MTELLNTLETLSSAEDFLDYLHVPYDPEVVKVKRLHILKRFHDYVGQAGLPGDLDDTALAAAYSRALQTAYADFVASSAGAEKVFKVFRTAADNAGFVPLSTLTRKS